jgi:hypothetical protein
MLRTKIYPLLMLACAVALPFANELQAADCACHHCGCHRWCNKVCRLVDDQKKVTIVCWGSECEDFCFPGKSCRGCLNREEVCTPDDTKEGEEPCSHSKDFVWYDWTPGCSKGIRTKKKLMKKTIEKKIPSYKWVVEDLCQECEDKTVATIIEPGYIVPLPPETNARLKYGVQQASGESSSDLQAIESKSPASSGSSLWPSWLWKSAGMNPK